MSGFGEYPISQSVSASQPYFEQGDTNTENFYSTDQGNVIPFPPEVDILKETAVSDNENNIPLSTSNNEYNYDTTSYEPIEENNIVSNINLDNIVTTIPEVNSYDTNFDYQNVATYDTNEYKATVAPSITNNVIQTETTTYNIDDILKATETPSYNYNEIYTTTETPSYNITDTYTTTETPIFNINNTYKVTETPKYNINDTYKVTTTPKYKVTDTYKVTTTPHVNVNTIKTTPTTVNKYAPKSTLVYSTPIVPLAQKKIIYVPTKTVNPPVVNKAIPPKNVPLKTFTPMPIPMNPSQTVNNLVFQNQYLHHSLTKATPTIPQTTTYIPVQPVNYLRNYRFLPMTQVQPMNTLKVNYAHVQSPIKNYHISTTPRPTNIINPLGYQSTTYNNGLRVTNRRTYTQSSYQPKVYRNIRIPVMGRRYLARKI